MYALIMVKDIKVGEMYLCTWASKGTVLRVTRIGPNWLHYILLVCPSPLPNLSGFMLMHDALEYLIELTPVEKEYYFVQD